MPDRPQRPRVVYRIVRSDPPTARDFLSPSALGRHFADPRQVQLASGLSVFRTEEQARRQARRYDLGRFLAELHLSDEWQVERTLRTSGHHTVFADTEVLLRAVVRVIAVD